MIKLTPLTLEMTLVQEYINEVLINDILSKSDIQDLLKIFIRSTEKNWQDFLKELIVSPPHVLIENSDYRIDMYLKIKQWQQTKLPSELENGDRAGRKERQDDLEYLRCMLMEYENDIHSFLSDRSNGLQNKCISHSFSQYKILFGAGIKSKKVYLDAKKNFIDVLDEKLLKLLYYKSYICSRLRAKLLLAYDSSICPYCNRQKIDIALDEQTGEFITTADFEHFIPVSKFPVFQLSIWNVLPSCLLCNRNFKNDKVLDLLNPLELGFENLAKFNIKNSDYYTDVAKKIDYKLEITEECPRNIALKIEKNIELFRLRQLYGTTNSQNRAKKIVEFYKKNKRFLIDNREYFDELRSNLLDFDLHETDFRNILEGKFESDIERFLLDI